MPCCQNCGNITLFNVTDGSEASPSRQWRETGEPTGFEVEHCEASPRCFLGLVQFPYGDEMTAQLSREWKCEKFVKWIPGLEPKDYAALAAHEAIERRADVHRWIGYAVSIVSAILGIVGSIVSAYLTAKGTMAN